MPFSARLVALALGLAFAGPAMSSSDTPASCDDAMVDRVLKQENAPEGGLLRASACSPLGGRAGLVAVALAYEPADHDRSDGFSLPVYVVWYDPQAGYVAASTRADISEDSAARVGSGALRWEPVPGLGRDAAALVVDDFALGSAMDGENGPTWTLFVADGSRLTSVLGPAMLSHARCEQACRFSDDSERHVRTLSFAADREVHHGLHDLVATLHDSTQGEPTRRQLRFNGRRYEPNVNGLVTR